MHWSYERSDYQVADVNGRAVLYEVPSDGSGLREQAADLTAEEIGQSLRMGGFQLADAVATPECQTPYIGDFRAVNGNRQFVGLEPAAAATGNGRGIRLVDGGSVAGGVLDGAVRGGFGRHIVVDDGAE
jgi:hypothetical protein